MTAIPTARGLIDTAQLGRTLMHEHIFVLTPDVQHNHDEWDEATRVEDAVSRLHELKAAGIDSIVDPTVIGLGRYVPRIAKIAAQVEMQIILATGVYTYNDVPPFFGARGPVVGLPEPMVSMFVRDLSEGIPGTDGVRAAFLKCAIDEPGMTAGVERIMRAVAAAHRETGAPITIHTHAASRSGLDAHKLLSSEGVDPGRVVLGHSGDSTDLDYLTELADLGYVLGMDRFGLYVGGTFDERVNTVVELVTRGYEERMVLSHDAACYLDWIEPSLMSYNATWHYRHITDDVVPALLERGVPARSIDAMLIDNPRRYFET